MDPMSLKKPTTSLEVATTVPEEYELISAIVADLRDEAAKLVYADWLEARGDPRSTFVRELVAATRSLGKRTGLPEYKDYPPAWANMLGVPLLEGIVEFDLLAVKDVVLHLARPIVTIATEPIKESRLGVGGSKFGGHPDLPSSVDWPACEMGPLGFLGQIALQDLKHTQVAHALPKDGLLSFFAYQSYETGHQPGVIGAAAGDTCVLYAPASAQLKRRQPPPDLGEDGNEILPACRLALRETWDLPDSQDTLPRTYAADLKKLQKGKHGPRLDEVREKCHPFGHHLLGYAVHFRTLTDPSPGADWSHLLCLDSDDHLGWSWCDGEHLAVYVHEDDLRKGTFARIYGYAS
jgi:uncharacterized protein (TIGR02996 family)